MYDCKPLGAGGHGGGPGSGGGPGAVHRAGHGQPGLDVQWLGQAPHCLFLLCRCTRGCGECARVHGYTTMKHSGYDWPGQGEGCGECVQAHCDQTMREEVARPYAAAKSCSSGRVLSRASTFRQLRRRKNFLNGRRRRRSARALHRCPRPPRRPHPRRRPRPRRRRRRRRRRPHRRRPRRRRCRRP